MSGRPEVRRVCEAMNRGACSCGRRSDGVICVVVEQSLALEAEIERAKRADDWTVEPEAAGAPTVNSTDYDFVNDMALSPAEWAAKYPLWRYRDRGIKLLAAFLVAKRGY